MTLTSEKIELIVYLIGAIIIGFIFGYLLALSKKIKENQIAQEKKKNRYNQIVTILDDVEDQKADK